MSACVWCGKPTMFVRAAGYAPLVCSSECGEAVGALARGLGAYADFDAALKRVESVRESGDSRPI